MFLFLFTHLFIYLNEETQTVGLAETEESLCSIHAQRTTKHDNVPKKPSSQKVNSQLWCVSGTNTQLLGMAKPNPGFDGFYCSNPTKPKGSENPGPQQISITNTSGILSKTSYPVRMHGYINLWVYNSYFSIS